MDSIVEKVKAHCLELLAKRCRTLPFHNVQHTSEVFENVQTIGEYEEVDEKEMEILKIAALFHDTGFSETYTGHENISICNSQIFLRKENCSENVIENIVNCIKVTKIPQEPHSKLERIICDADLFHLSSSNYFIKNFLLRREWNQCLNLDFTDEQWETLNINFFENHEYKTSYGKKYLAPRKLMNVAKMETMCH